MSSSSDAAVSAAWAPSLDLTAEGLSRFDPARVQRAIEDGYQAGLRAGRAEGAAEGRRQLAGEIAETRRTSTQLLAGLQRATERLAQQEQAAAATFAERVADVAVRLAEAIVQRELTDETVAAVAACERALGALGNRDRARLRLHPADVELLEGADLPDRVELEPDTKLQRGDALAQTDDRTVDARISTALERALAVLEGQA